MKLRTGVLRTHTPPPLPLPPSLNIHGGFGGGADGDADGIFLHLRQRFTFTDKTCFSPSRVVKLKSEPVCSGFKGLIAGLGPLFWERRAEGGETCSGSVRINQLWERRRDP